jgi:hypothetical protein
MGGALPAGKGKGPPAAAANSKNYLFPTLFFLSSDLGLVTYRATVEPTDSIKPVSRMQAAIMFAGSNLAPSPGRTPAVPLAIPEFIEKFQSGRTVQSRLGGLDRGVIRNG